MLVRLTAFSISFLSCLLHVFPDLLLLWVVKPSMAERTFEATSLKVEGMTTTVQLQMTRVANPETEQVRERKQCDLWAYVWGSSAVLSMLLCSLPTTLLERATCLELGAGSGAPSLCAAKLGARVTVTDLVEDALRLCESNAEANGVPVTCQVLNWDKPAKLSPTGYDLIVGADVIYLGRAVKPIARIIKGHLKDDRSLAIVVDPGRTNGDDFEDICRYEFDLACERQDIWRIRTPICNMRKVSIFLLALCSQQDLVERWSAWLQRFSQHFVSPFLVPEDDSSVSFSYRQE